MPRHPNDPIITPEMICLHEADLEAMTHVEFRNLIVPMMNILSTKHFSKRNGGPFGMISKWLKTYSRKRVYGVVVHLYKTGHRKDALIGTITTMLKEKYIEGVEYEELDSSEEARYGG